MLHHKFGSTSVGVPVINAVVILILFVFASASAFVGIKCNSTVVYHSNKIICIVS